MKDGKQVTEILEAFDLTGSFRAAGELAGCSPNTVADWVAKRDRGELGDLAEPVHRERLLDEFLPKIEEWVDRSQGKIRADKCHERLETLGYAGSDRTVRRAVAEVKASLRSGRRRVYRPWIVEPGCLPESPAGLTLHSSLIGRRRCRPPAAPIVGGPGGGRDGPKPEGQLGPPEKGP